GRERAGPPEQGRGPAPLRAGTRAADRSARTPQARCRHPRWRAAGLSCYTERTARVPVRPRASCPGRAARRGSPLDATDTHTTRDLRFAMRWRLLLTPPLSGADNMALDEALLERAGATGEAVCRVYSWGRPTLSLGRNQSA